MQARVQAWYDALPPAWQERAYSLRELLMDAAPEIKEEWKYAVPFYSRKRSLCYLSFQRGQLILGFVDGAALSTAHGLFLETAHKRIRHVAPPPTPRPFDERALKALIQEALAYELLTLKQKGARRR